MTTPGPALSIGSVVWGVRDVPTAIRFWTRALSYQLREAPDDDWAVLIPGSGPGVQLALKQVSSSAKDHARHHLDLYASDQVAEVERLLALGAHRVEWRYEPGADYVVLADPDGNRFCVVHKPAGKPPVNSSGDTARSDQTIAVDGGTGLDSPGARLLQKRGLEASAFTRAMGTRLRRFREGTVEIELDLRPDLTQHHGQAHGAVLGYLADTVSAWAAASVAGDVVTAEYKLNFLAAARGELLWARGEVLRAGKRQVIVRADVYATQDGHDTHVAAALATIVPVRERSDAAQ